MDRLERIKMVHNELEGAITRVIREYSLSYAEIIGIIEILKLNLYNMEDEDD